MANKKVSQLTSKPAVNLTDLFLIADPTSGQAFKTTISDLGTAIGSGVSSVNTLVGAVVLDTDDIQELASPTNRWFTDTRARAAISGGTGISYNSGTGVITNDVTSGQIATALGYTPANGADYLPLAGGTMGGAIFGTIATFASSTSVTALGITLSGATGDGVKITHSAGRAFNIQSSGSGFGILINNETASTSAPFTIQKQGLAVITLTDAGAGSFASSLTANSFVKTSGTSSQFLKADGSVDSSVYALDSAVVKLTGNQTIAGTKTFSDGSYHDYGLLLKHGTSTNAPGYTGIAGTSSGIKIGVGTPYHSNLVFSTSAIYTYTFPSVTGTLALTSDLSAYLPLSGGTLTGALSGTSASFSSTVSSSTKFVSQAGNNSIVFESLSATTGFQYIQLLNSTAHTIFGIEGTSAGSLLTGGTANASVFTTAGNTNLEFGTNQVKRLTIAASTGAATFSSSVTATQVGVNTTTPNAVLEVAGTSANTDFRVSRTVSSSTYFFIKAPGGTPSASTMGVNGTDVMTLNASGNVGIGTTTPSDRLNVSGNIGATGYVYSNDGTRSIFLNPNADFGSGGSPAIQVASNHPLQFATNNTERMRITSGGNVGIGTTSPSSALSGSAKVLAIVDNTTANLSSFRAYGGASSTSVELYASGGEVGLFGSTNHAMAFHTNSSERMRINSNGSIQMSNNSTTFSIGSIPGVQRIQYGTGGYTTEFAFLQPNDGYTSIGAGAFNTRSDYRLKEDLKEFNGLSLITNMKVYDFKWKEKEERNYGFMAHELQEVLPYVVTGKKDGMFEDKPQMQGLDYSKIVPVMVQAIKELKAELDTLKNK
jgi:hypothetical protein